MADQSCKTCYFYRFDPIEDAMRGSCRFEPPKLVHVPGVDGSVQLTSATPTVSQDWWCGKWQRIMQEWETANQHATK